MKLHVSPDLGLPDDTVTSTLVVYGGKGMGKTNFGSVLVEELAKRGERFSVLDPLDVWWGLQHGATRDVPGLSPLVILGGPHGDLPIRPVDGEIVADFVVDESVSTVIVLRKPDGTMWSNGERIRFATDYATRLYARQGEKRLPLMQVFDEAGRLVPQMQGKGDVEIAKCIGAIEQLVEWGRNVGVGVTLITQRSARMNKSVSELADCMVAFRTVGPRSIDAIVDWFGEHIPKARQNALIEQMRELDVGQALVVSPGWLRFEGAVTIRPRETFDSSATPKVGKQLRAPGKATKPDIEKYRARMEEVVERAEAEDPKALQRRVRELERTLETRKPSEVPDPIIERVEIEHVPPDLVNLLHGIDGEAQLLDEARRSLVDLLDDVGRRLKEKTADAFAIAKRGVVERDERALSASSRGRGAATPSRPKSSTARAITPRSQPDDPVRPASISRPQQKLLDALAWFEAIDVTPRRPPLAAVAGSSSKSSGFEKNLSTLRTAGLIDYPSPARVSLTEAGQSAANYPEARPTSDALQEAVYSMVSGPQAQLLRVLVAAYPHALSREELADRAGVSAASSGFEKNISTLRSFELIDYPARGQVAALPVLFLEEAA